MKNSKKLNTRFLKRFCKKNKFTEEKYHENRIPYVRDLKKAYEARVGGPVSIKPIKDFLDKFFNYSYPLEY